MNKEILRCPKCGKYTMQKMCEKCCTEAISTKPAKYSVEDKYGEYRRKFKKESNI